MNERPKVALLIESSNAYSRDLLHGIRAWQRDHDAWSIRLSEHARGESPPKWLQNWDGAGIIARVENQTIAKALLKTSLPIVDVSAALPKLPFTRVVTDNEAATQLAIDHLRECGLTQFAYCGNSRFHWSEKRYRYFAATIEALNCTCYNFPSHSKSNDGNEDEEQQVKAIAAWIAELPKPIGILACYDLRGQQVIEACRHADVRVPDDVAVIGVHNDELLCDLCDPPLTSVIPNAKGAGYRAAELLSQKMAANRKSQKSGPAQTHLIAPIGVARRQSTDLVAIDDPKISQALQFMRAHANEGITVSDVLQAVPMSRTLLERSFKRNLGLTPHNYLINIRVERVKKLLATTKTSIGEIAEKCGFEHIEYLSVAFKRQTGKTPSEYRKQTFAS